MVYFSEAPIPQSMLAGDQYQKLQDAKEDISKKGLYASFKDTNELGMLFTLHLNGLVNELLLKDRANGQPIPSSGTLTSPTPDIRVLVHPKQLILGQKRTDVISVEIQNHSPHDFYLSSVSIEIDTPKAIWFPQDALGQHQVTRKIEPGNSHDVILIADHVVKAAKGARLVCAVAVDKIDRRFRSAPGMLENAINKALATI